MVRAGRWAPALWVLLSPAVIAQGPGNMEQMMQGMAQMAACVQQVDQQHLEALGREGESLHSELKQLCADGERDRAQARAVELGRKFMESPDFQQLRQCGELAMQMLPQFPDYSAYADDNSESQDLRHICDAL